MARQTNGCCCSAAGTHGIIGGKVVSYFFLFPFFAARWNENYSTWYSEKANMLRYDSHTCVQCWLGPHSKQWPPTSSLISNYRLQDWSQRSTLCIERYKTHTPKGITKKEERVCFIYKRIWAPAFEIQKATMTNKWGHTFRTWIEKKWTNTAHNSLGIFQKIKHQIQIHHWAFQNCHSPGLFNKTSILPVWPLEMLQCPWYTITPECPFKNWIGQVVTFHYYCCILFV